MHLDLTAEQQYIIGQAQLLAQEKLAPRAARYDEEEVFPYENFADLHQAGLLQFCVPKEYGGGDGGQGEGHLSLYLAVLELAKGCGSTALCFGHHCTMLALVRGLGTEAQLMPVIRRWDRCFWGYEAIPREFFEKKARPMSDADERELTGGGTPPKQRPPAHSYHQVLQQELMTGYLNAAAPYWAAEMYAIDDTIIHNADPETLEQEYQTYMEPQASTQSHRQTQPKRICSRQT